MDSDQPAVNEIQEINLSYLLLAQRMLREDVATGMFRLGLSAEVAEILMALTVQQIARIAACGQMLCQLRFESPEILAVLARHGPLRSVANMHAAILLAGMPTAKLV
ncbi:flagellar transcriptional regulator FlhD [Paraburkholderia sp. BR10872]|uniref:flagellar transcriptional regulator FlhD n=1 Tax=Paraburkholderia sp. BR10872 TaxID=3236989 RepID=UPI0034D32F5F